VTVEEVRDVAKRHGKDKREREPATPSSSQRQKQNEATHKVPPNYQKQMWLRVVQEVSREGGGKTGKRRNSGVGGGR